MSKVVEIKKCHECPHYWSREWWHAPFNCSLVKRLWGWPGVIPDWCPLPDAPKIAEMAIPCTKEKGNDTRESDNPLMRIQELTIMAAGLVELKAERDALRNIIIKRVIPALETLPIDVFGEGKEEELTWSLRDELIDALAKVALYWQRRSMTKDDFLARAKQGEFGPGVKLFVETVHLYRGRAEQCQRIKES